MKRNSLFYLGAVAIALVAGVVTYFVVNAHARHFTLIHVNDTHSHFEPIKSGDCAGMGGIIERTAYIDSVRNAVGKDNLLLLHAGDFSQGTTYFSELGGDLEIDALNSIGYDAVTLGNHEFDNGLENLGDRLEKLRMPVVCCNLDFSPFKIGQFVKPYTIVEKGGVKIGIIGVVCSLKDMVAGDISDRVPEREMIPTVQLYADSLKYDYKCDMVIALTHIGYTEHNPGNITDPMLVEGTSNIDLVVGGHSHTFLESLPRFRNKAKRRIPVTQDGWMGAWLGQAEITVR